jgi:hypothetical protein
MKNRIAIIICLLIGSNCYTQTQIDKYIGLNLLQLPALTINSNFSFDYKPYLTPMIDLGYTFNYVNAANIDWIGFFLTPHAKSNDGFTFEKQSGGYIKIGGFLNLRSDFEKKSYFHFGLFITNSLVYEKLPTNNSGPYPVSSKIDHTIFLLGLSTSGGYEFSLTKRFSTNIDFQISFPSNNYNDLYGYRSFVPGMGFKDTSGKWFPMMMILNIKYRL